MTSLRALLRLDDKVAAEGRRLARLGGPRLGRTAAMALLAAVVAHAAILLLPTVRTGGTLPPSTPAPDFPRVWRFSPIASGAFAEVAARPSAPTAPSGTPSADAVPEPVPEPIPDLATGGAPLDVDAIIPAPDEPPPTFESGPSAGSLAAAPPALLSSVQPVFPAAARTMGATGRVTLRLDITPDGAVESASILECTRPRVGFEGAALDAVRQWRYEADSTRTGTRAVVVTIEFKRQTGAP